MRVDACLFSVQSEPYTDKGKGQCMPKFVVVVYERSLTYLPLQTGKKTDTDREAILEAGGAMTAAAH